MKSNEEIIEKFTASSAGINKMLARDSHRNTSFDPELRAQQEIDGFRGEVQTVYNELKPYAKSDAMLSFLNGELDRFQTGYTEKYNSLLASKGRCFSVMITGGSGFNNARHEKANRQEQNKYDNLIEFKERAKTAIIRELKKMATEDAGGELAVLERKIKSLEDNQILMVSANKIIRNKKNPKEQTVAELLKLGLNQAIIDEILKPDYMGNVGYAGFHLSNASANIRASKKHLEELKTRDATPTSDIKFSSGTIQDSQEHDRVRIFYNEKPAQDIIDKLKAEGWRWSPAMHAWQRKRTMAAMQSAKRITGATS